MRDSKRVDLATGIRLFRLEVDVHFAPCCCWRKPIKLMQPARIQRASLQLVAICRQRNAHVSYLLISGLSTYEFQVVKKYVVVIIIIVKINKPCAQLGPTFNRHLMSIRFCAINIATCSWNTCEAPSKPTSRNLSDNISIKERAENYSLSTFVP